MRTIAMRILGIGYMDLLEIYANRYIYKYMKYMPLDIHSPCISIGDEIETCLDISYTSYHQMAVL